MLIADRSELAIRCVLNRVSKSTDIQRLGPNLDRSPRECGRISLQAFISLAPQYVRRLSFEEHGKILAPLPEHVSNHVPRAARVPGRPRRNSGAFSPTRPASPVGLYEIRSVYISRQEGGTNELNFLTRPLGSISV